MKCRHAYDILVLKVTDDNVQMTTKLPKTLTEAAEKDRLAGNPVRFRYT